MTGGGATTGTGATTCGDTGPARVARVVSAWTREGASARWLVHVLDLVLVLVLVGPGPGRSWPVRIPPAFFGRRWSWSWSSLALLLTPGRPAQCEREMQIGQATRRGPRLSPLPGLAGDTGVRRFRRERNPLQRHPGRAAQVVKRGPIRYEMPIII